MRLHPRKIVGATEPYGVARVHRASLSRGRGLVAMGAVGALALAACGGGSGSSSSGSGGAGGGGTVVVGYENNGADPSMVSIAKKYFAKEMGTTVSLKYFASGPASLSAIASGALQFMCGLGVPPTISAMAKGVPLQVVFNQERYTTDAGLVVKKGSGLKTLADLKGKTLGIVVGSEATFELAEFLKGSGISQSDIHQLNMSPQQMQSAWSTGAIKAAIVWDPVFGYLASHGGVVLKTDKVLPIDASSYNVCVANKNYASSHPKVAVGFVKGLNDGVSYTKAHHEDAVKLMAKQAGIKLPAATQQLAGYQIYSLSDQVTPAVLGKGSAVGSAATTKSFTNNWKVLHDEGFQPVAPPSNMAQYINSTYAAKALGGS